jgi:hypothetical protein
LNIIAKDEFLMNEFVRKLYCQNIVAMIVKKITLASLITEDIDCIIKQKFISLYLVKSFISLYLVKSFI